MRTIDGLTSATVDGILLFGRNPKRFLPQSGIRAIAYKGDKADYAALADRDLRGPLTPLCAENGARNCFGRRKENSVDGNQNGGSMNCLKHWRFE